VVLGHHQARPAKWVCFHLYVILDVFSRYVVGWMIAPQESAELAHTLIAATCDKEGIARGQFTLHADRGTSMRSKPVAMLLADLGVTKSHSRPHVSDDNHKTATAHFTEPTIRAAHAARRRNITMHPGDG
jgi:putative transposase